MGGREERMKKGSGIIDAIYISPQRVLQRWPFQYNKEKQVLSTTTFPICFNSLNQIVSPMRTRQYGKVTWHSHFWELESLSPLSHKSMPGMNDPSQPAVFPHTFLTAQIFTKPNYNFLFENNVIFPISLLSIEMSLFPSVFFIPLHIYW